MTISSLCNLTMSTKVWFTTLSKLTLLSQLKINKTLLQQLEMRALNQTLPRCANRCARWRTSTRTETSISWPCSPKTRTSTINFVSTRTSSPKENSIRRWRNPSQQLWSARSRDSIERTSSRHWLIWNNPLKMITLWTATLHGRTPTCASGGSIKSKPLMKDTKRRHYCLIGVYRLARCTGKETSSLQPPEYKLIKSRGSSETPTINNSTTIKVKGSWW